MVTVDWIVHDKRYNCGVLKVIKIYRYIVYIKKIVTIKYGAVRIKTFEALIYKDFVSAKPAWCLTLTNYGIILILKNIQNLRENHLHSFEPGNEKLQYHLQWCFTFYFLFHFEEKLLQWYFISCSKWNHEQRCFKFEDILFTSSFFEDELFKL